MGFSHYVISFFRGVSLDRAPSRDFEGSSDARKPKEHTVRIVSGSADFFSWMMDVSNPVGFPANPPDDQEAFAASLWYRDNKKAPD